MGLSRSNALPDFHDGSFDGLWILGNKKVHLFLTNVDKERVTIVLDGVEALWLRDIWAGNIIFDVLIVDTNELTESHIESVYKLSDIAKEGQIAALLASAQTAGLRGLEIMSSYGAEGIVLFKGIELSKGPHENAGRG